MSTCISGYPGSLERFIFSRTLESPQCVYLSIEYGIYKGHVYLLLPTVWVGIRTEMSGTCPQCSTIELLAELKSNRVNFLISLLSLFPKQILMNLNMCMYKYVSCESLQSLLSAFWKESLTKTLGDVSFCFDSYHTIKCLSSLLLVES